MIFTLKKDAWHAKLMKYIWNLDHTDFSHMCPYFWLSVANFFIFSWIFFIGKSIGKLFSVTRDSIGKFKRKRKEKRSEIREQKRMTLSQMVDELLEKMKEDPVLTESIAKKFGQSEWGYAKLSKVERALYSTLEYQRSMEEWRKKFDEWLSDSKARAHTYWVEQQDKLREAKKARVDKVNKLVAISKPIAQGIIFTAAGLTLLLCGYLLYQGGVAVTHVSSLFWGEFRWWLGFVIFLLGMLILIAWIATLLVELIRSIDFKIEMSERTGERIRNFFYFIFIKSWISRGLVWFFRGAGQFFYVLSQMFKNNCPPINWK